jgi:dihydrofolate reductase
LKVEPIRKSDEDMNLIVCVDQEFGIGKNGDLLEKIPEDLQFFKKMTLEKTIIMGRATFESLPNQKPLKNRKHIVLSTKKEYAPHSDVIVCHSLDEVLAITKDTNPEDLFVIGGGKVYTEFLPYCDKAYITKILKTYDADTHFVNIDQLKNWFLNDEGEVKLFESIPYQFCTYVRKV